MDWNPPTRKRTLTAEEAELWTFAMREARALRRRDRERAAGPVAEHDAAPPIAAAMVSADKPASSVKPASAAAKPARGATKEPPLAAFEEKQRRRLARNPDLIDARLDLHGFRQREAYGALRSFLLNAYARGQRHVLVITGKGASAADLHRDRDFLREERGVLRRLVPQWLTEPDLRGLVVSYTASHVRHGGDGALYVRLRKPGAR